MMSMLSLTTLLGVLGMFAAVALTYRYLTADATPSLRHTTQLPLTPTVLAWLGGGPNRVREMWWVALSDPPKQTDVWLEQVLHQLRPATLLNNAWAAMLNDVHQSVMREGLVQSQSVRFRRYAVALAWVVSLGGLAFLLARFWPEVGNSPMVFFWLLGIGGAIAVSLSQRVPCLTAQGRLALEHAKRERRHVLLAPTHGRLVEAVALGGVGVLAGTPYEAYVPAPNPARSDSSSCGSGVFMGGDSGGGDGGAGGCGGGGCGGCGG